MNAKPIDTEGYEYDVQPSREQLAMIAAASHRQNPPEAISYAFALWREAGKALEAEARTQEQRQFRDIPLPQKFPATLDDFLRLVVKGKTLADATKKFRSYFRSTLHYHPTRLPVPLEPSSSEASDPDAGEVDPEKWAASAIQGWKGCGFRQKEQWWGLAVSYLTWWRQQKSISARKSASKRRS